MGLFWLVLSSAALGLALHLAFSIATFLLATRRPPNYPPGPPPVLGLGNLHQMPADRPFLQFHKWFREHGDIVGLKVGPKNIVVLSNPVHVRELFGRRGGGGAPSYADRPRSAVLDDYIAKDGDATWITLGDGATLRRWRAATRHAMGPEGIARVAPVQSAMGNRMLHDLLREPESWPQSLRRWALASPLFAISGHMLEDYEPDFADRYFDVQHEYLNILEPNSAPPIEILPFLAYVPKFLAKWKQRAAWVSDAIYRVYNKNLELSKTLHESGRTLVQEPLIPHLLELRRRRDARLAMPDNELAQLAGGLLDGAVDTTWGSTGSIMQVLTAHPNVMRRAQAEIDNVCANKCPGPEDAGNLPYLKACILEVFRWRGPAQFSLPHLSSEDDVFKGYAIPKGTTVIASLYSMHLHPDDFENPDEFDPERYVRNPFGLRDSSPALHQEGRKNTYSFGIGRRVCPGEDFAKTIIIMTVAKLLWAFDFEAIGEIDLSWETGYRPGLSNPPTKFLPRVKPRSPTRAKDIVAEFNKAEAYLAAVKEQNLS